MIKIYEEPWAAYYNVLSGGLLVFGGYHGELKIINIK
jgi:hypothetical protein